MLQRNSFSNHLLAAGRLLFSGSGRTTLATVPSTPSSDDHETVVPVGSGEGPRQRGEQISRAMKVYLAQAQAKDLMMQKERATFDLGKRHLANIMGVDVADMTQRDINRAIQYLFPSGLFDIGARPVMKPPEQLFASMTAVKFDESGRPIDSLFYTLRPNFYRLLTDIARKTDALMDHADQVRRKQGSAPKDSQIISVGSTWVSMESFSQILGEKITEEMYAQLVAALENLMTIPFAHMERDFIFKYRKMLGGGKSDGKQKGSFLPVVEIDATTGRRFATAFGGKKKTRAFVTIHDAGTGKYTVNGHGIDTVRSLQAREMLLAPFITLNKLGQFDVEARTEGPGGLSSIPAAIRLGVSFCLSAFVSDVERNQLRLAGLLTRDPRRRERSKVNQPGARQKWTWKRR
uniref:Mitochondrial ribosomal protein S9 n=1 Tax=Plectus sambesii TaxID=2011161 RepID=A0A914W2R1_9BILA